MSVYLLKRDIACFARKLQLSVKMEAIEFVMKEPRDVLTMVIFATASNRPKHRFLAKMEAKGFAIIVQKIVLIMTLGCVVRINQIKKTCRGLLLLAVESFQLTVKSQELLSAEKKLMVARIMATSAPMVLYQSTAKMEAYAYAILVPMDVITMDQSANNQ